LCWGELYWGQLCRGELYWGERHDFPPTRGCHVVDDRRAADDDFVEVVTQGQSVAPLYFAFATDANRQHHKLLDDRDAPVALDIGEVLRQDTWRLDVGGLVDQPQALTLRDLHT
jgi:DMSO/TMAO reductase YedYZ molybdopterin-dependent catalytic subunit